MLSLKLKQIIGLLKTDKSQEYVITELKNGLIIWAKYSEFKMGCMTGIQSEIRGEPEREEQGKPRSPRQDWSGMKGKCFQVFLLHNIFVNQINIKILIGQTLSVLH